METEVYTLHYLKGDGIPKVSSHGTSEDNYLIIMELLDKSLENLINENGKKFSLKTVCMVANQIVLKIII